MPIVGLQAVTFTIGDLAGEVIIKCENRTNDLARAYVWVKDALIEIASNPEFRDDFYELEIAGPLFNLTVGTQEYDFSNIVPAGDLNLATLDIMLWTDPPTNARRVQLEGISFQTADRVNPINGQPSQWYRFNDSIGFVNPPDKTYQIQARITRQHPIAENDIKSTVVLLSRDWHLIIVLLAVEIGFMELLEFEKADEIHRRLHGDPKYPEMPGLLSGRKKRRRQEDWRREKALRPVVRRYCK